MSDIALVFFNNENLPNMITTGFLFDQLLSKTVKTTKLKGDTEDCQIYS